MNHNWKERAFNNDGVYEGTRTATQSYECAYCGKKITLPYGIVPNVPSQCIDTREERELALQRAEKMRARQHQGWGNGNKARKRRK